MIFIFTCFFCFLNYFFLWSQFICKIILVYICDVSAFLSCLLTICCLSINTDMPSLGFFWHCVGRFIYKDLLLSGKSFWIVALYRWVVYVLSDFTWCVCNNRRQRKQAVCGAPQTWELERFSLQRIFPSPQKVYLCFLFFLFF